MSQPGLQGDIALSKDRLQVNQNWRDSCHLLQETHPNRDQDWPVIDGLAQLSPGDLNLCVNAVLWKENKRKTQ